MALTTLFNPAKMVNDNAPGFNVAVLVEIFEIALFLQQSEYSNTQSVQAIGKVISAVYSHSSYPGNTLLASTHQLFTLGHKSP